MIGKMFFRFMANAIGLSLIVFYTYFVFLAIYSTILKPADIAIIYLRFPAIISLFIIASAGCVPSWRKNWCEPL